MYGESKIMMRKGLTVALSKGKLLSPAINLLSRVGISVPTQPTDSRSLIFESTSGDMTFLIIRPTDVPTYVEHGSADVGIAGKDVLLEQSSDVYEPLDLKFGKCKIVLAGPQKTPSQERPNISCRIATKYPNITKNFFAPKGVQVEAIKLNGSMELAPSLLMCRRIVDLVSTGKTLEENGLKEVEKIMDVQSKLIVNRSSYKTNAKKNKSIINSFEKIVK